VSGRRHHLGDSIGVLDQLRGVSLIDPGEVGDEHGQPRIPGLVGDIDFLHFRDYRQPQRFGFTDSSGGLNQLLGELHHTGAGHASIIFAASIISSLDRMKEKCPKHTVSNPQCNASKQSNR
jgi:hypothetical protein